MLAFLSHFCHSSSELPLLGLVESKICDEFYDGRVAEDKICKIPQIQDKVAMIIGAKTTFDSIPRNLVPLMLSPETELM